MVPLDHSAGHALGRAMRVLSGEHSIGPTAAITHQIVVAYTYPTIARVAGCRRSQALNLSMFGSLMDGRDGEIKFHFMNIPRKIPTTCLSP